MSSKKYWVAASERSYPGTTSNGARRACWKSLSIRSFPTLFNRANNSMNRPSKNWRTASASTGIVQPLVVTRSGDRYKLIAGERRFRAAKKAGLQRVPVVVKELAGEGEALQLALIENIQREDLNPIEEAAAYHQLHQEFRLTQDEISKQVGKERSTVANFLRLMKLPETVKQLLAAGELSMGHARALLSLDSHKKQEQLAERVVRRNLNVRQTEILASGPARTKKPRKAKDVFTRDAEEKLTRHLHSRVEITRKKKGGVIEINFSSEDDLIRLYEELTAHGRKR